MQRWRAGGFTGLAVLAGVAIAALLTLALTVWTLRWVFPSHFEPVQLTAGEQRVFEAKIRRIGFAPAEVPPPEAPPDHPAPLEPQPYREDPAAREIGITERELNALLAHNTNLADRLAIDLSAGLASAKLLIPVDPDFPVIGGRIVRASAGVELEYAGGRPRVMLRGISLMGVPLPNAWLGNLKNVDLVERFGAEPGFWHTFAAGIEQLEIRDGELKLQLKE